MQPANHKGAHALGALAAMLVLSVALTACGSGGSGGGGAGKPMPLKVMVFNIEYGGTLVSFKKVVEAVKKADPDVVGIEEAEANTPKLARQAGYPYYNSSMQIVSKYPILEPSGADGVYAFIEVQPGKVVALSNVHLPSDPYGPYWVRDGKTVDQVLAMEDRVRVPAIQKQVTVLPGLAGRGIPVFVTGDFNEPSHLDYTAAAVGARKQINYAIEWPVSKALAGAGFRDSYRETHPDPVKDPGLTWWAARPKVAAWAGNPTAKDPQDRIDFVYASGPSRTVASVIVGEEGDPAVSVSVSPWPSDHRAVLSTFEVTPAPMPVLVATNKWLLTQGEPLVVTYHSPAKGGEKIQVVAAGHHAEPGVQKAAAAADGRVTFATAGLAPGAYDAALVGEDGATLASTPFWVRAKGAKVELTTAKQAYAVGEPIVVSWANAPADRWDWLGVYKASAADPANDYYLIWQYTGGAMAGTVHGMPAGTLSMDGATTEGKPWPLPKGRYRVYYLLADAYDAVAHADFTVTK
jgi:endonuclease/exonuclease/phosphatase family metal-dependent hydrolase